MSTNIEPYAGKDLGENTFTCTAKMVDDYCVGLAVDPSRYEDTSAWGEPAAPAMIVGCLLYTSPSPRDRTRSRMPSSA